MSINIKAVLGDCLEKMKDIPDKSVDFICTDLPYEVTKNKNDIKIPFGPLWAEYKRIIKGNGAIALFGQGLFYVDLVNSNRKMFRYDLIWDKVLTSSFFNANRMPLRQHEQIAIFYKKLPTYNPQKTLGKENHSKGAPKKNKNTNYGQYEFVDNKEKLGNMKFPTSIIRFAKPHPSICKHSTEKSIECLEWLIKTYTNEDDTVLDSCAGSFTTAIACIKTKRNCICIEKIPETYEDGIKRLIDYSKHRYKRGWLL